MKKVLITGGNGLIGYELIQDLLQEHQVYSISRSDGGVVHPNFHFVNINLGTDFSTNQLPEKIDYIYHLAQSENFRDFPEKSEDVFKVNTLSTLKLLNYAIKAGCEKFVYASSGGVYGNSDIGFTEDNSIKPTGEIGFYLSSKYCSELIVENYSKFFDVIICRFFFVFGERQDKSMLIPRLIQNVINGNKITLQGEEGLKINPIYVKDAVAALQKILSTNGSNKFNIGGDEVVSLKELCEKIARILNKQADYIYQDVLPKNLIGDINKMKKYLHQPIYKLEDSLKLLTHNVDK